VKLFQAVGMSYKQYEIFLSKQQRDGIVAFQWQGVILLTATSGLSTKETITEIPWQQYLVRQ